MIPTGWEPRAENRRRGEAVLCDKHARDLLRFCLEEVACEERCLAGHARQAGGDSTLKLRRHGYGGLGAKSSVAVHCKRARSTATRIVLRPECRYQALRRWRTAARLRGLTAALRPNVGHPCRSTAQWIA